MLQCAGKHFILLDGALSSMVLSIGNVADILRTSLLAQWAWSSNVNHAVVKDSTSDAVSVLRWDRPGDIHEDNVSTADDAQKLLSSLAIDLPESTATAISQTLAVFRSLRVNLLEHCGNDLDAIKALNVLLLSADAIRRGSRDLSLATLERAVEVLNGQNVISYSAADFSRSVRHFPLGELANQLLEDHAGLQLDPYLLIRHASGTLFQEAHNALDVPPQPRLFVELQRKPPRAKKSTQRDARYTPATLARFLAESAIAEFTRLNPSTTAVDILDPACGSGVFLIEATRASKKLKTMRLRGVDKSPASVVIAEFSVQQAAKSRTNGLTVEVAIESSDSLAKRDWGSPDIILMNPPFLAWRVSDAGTKASIKNTLGDLYKGQSDTSIAFVDRAVRELKPGAVLATLVPSSFLESRAAHGLRQSIANDDTLSIRLIGRFRGFKYFKNAAVEPAFLLISRSRHDGDRVRTMTPSLIAKILPFGQCGR